MGMTTNHNLDIYSPYKAAHHTDKMEDFRAGRHPVPLQVQMIISDLCNHNCSFCSYRMEGYTSNQNFGEWDAVKKMVNNNPNRMIPYEKCIEIIDDCADMGVKAIQFTGGGEPTVHPKHKELFQHTIDKGLELALVTNGTMLREGVPEILAQGSWVRFSVDAGNSKSYSEIREVPESFFQKTIDNIKKVVEVRNKTNSNLVIGVGFVVCRENWKELYEAAKIFSELGVDNMRISAAFTSDEFEYHADYYEEARDLAAKTKKDFDSPQLKVFNLFGDRVEDLIQSSPDYDFCPYMHLNVYIGGDQKVYSCCNTAYNRHGERGTIHDKSFKEFWFSQEKEDSYNAFKPRDCERCMFNNKNRFVNYLIKDNPGHLNYI